MSSSNEVNIIYVEEATYDQTPSATPFDTVRKVSDGLSGTPNTVVSDEARSDRQSGGQAAVGMAIGGPIAFQLSRGKAFDDFIQAAMYDTWSATASQATVPMSIAVSNGVGTLDRVSGDWTTTFSVGDFAQISTATDPENNEVILITSLTADVISFVGPATMVANPTDSPTVTRLSRVRIGTQRRSFSIEKQFTDISKYIAYTGMRLAGMKLNAQVNQIVSGEFTFGGASYSTPATSIADGETVNVADSSPLINPQVDMGFIAVDGVVAQYTIESIDIDLNNNLSPEEGVGKLGATDQIPFEAAVGISMTAHLTASNFSLIQNKIDQTPISIAFFLTDGNGDGYAVHIPEAQLSFPDPSMGGKNEHVMISMTGVAKYSDTIGNTMTIARIGAV